MSKNMPPTTIAEGRFEQVLAEILWNEEQGTPVDVEQVVQAYPDLESSMREYFRNRARFDRLAPILAPTPPPGGAVAVPPDLSPGSRFGGYEIIKKLGHGGMGIVYQARQLSPERDVALKVIRTDRLAVLSANEQRLWLDRFRREAQLVASLEEHPNLVTLYEVGEHDGRPFYTMRLLSESLAESVASGKWAVGRKGAASRAAEQVATVARAVDYVHQRGVLHQDLKLGNILLDDAGRPLVSDFGLARRMDQSGSLVTGAIEGTAEYMAPEQARALPGAATTAADIYSLGAILYWLLTGRPPFRGATDFETLMLVMGREATPPRVQNPSVPRDLDIICLKCLEKEPSRRYKSAAALAEDLENWLAGRPINARRTGAAGRLWRWSGRNPAPAALASALVLSLGAGIAVSSWFAVQSAADATAATIAKGDADEKANEANEQTRIAKVNLDEAQRKERLQRRRYYISRINLAQQSLNDSLVAPTLKYLKETTPTPHEENFRGFEWHYLDRQCRKEVRILQGHSQSISPVRYSRDGKLIATLERDGLGDGTVRIWDAATGSEIRSLKQNVGAIEQIAFSPDGKRIASTGNSIPKGRNPYMTPDGKRFLTPEERIAAAALWIRTLIVWDVETGREALSLKEGGSGVAFSPDGKFIATHRKECVAVLDSISGEVLQTIPRPDVKNAMGLSVSQGYCLAFSPDSKTLAYGGIDKPTGKGTVIIWDLTSKEPRHVLLGHSDRIECVAFNPQGRVLASGSWDGTVRLWDTATGKERSVLRGFKVCACDIAFNPRTTLLKGAQNPQGFAMGQLLCACNFNSPDSDGTPRTARIWAVDTGDTELDTRRGHVETGTEMATLKGHVGNVTSIAFSPQDNHLASAGNDGTVRVWDLTDVGDATGVFFGSSDMYVDCNEKGATCALGMQWAVQVKDLSRGKELFKIQKPISNLAMSADGSVLAIASPPPPGAKEASGEIILYDIPSGVVRKTLSALPEFVQGWRWQNFPRGLALSSDGKLLASGSEDATIRIRDTFTGNEVCSFPAPGGTLQIVFHPKNRQFACVNRDGKVRLWDLETRREKLDLSVGKGFPSAISFSPDGKLMAIAENENGPYGVASHAVVRVREVSSGKERFMVEGHNNLIRCVAFHPDGRRLVTGSDDRTAKLWDLETRQELLTLGTHTYGVHGVAFAADGQYLLTAEGPIPSQIVRTASLSGQPLAQQFMVKSWNATPHPSRAQDEKLLAVLSGKLELGSAKELMELARFATHSRGQFAATRDLFVDYLGRRPGWASYVPDQPPFLGDHPPYYAAASASMAARGEGDAKELTSEQRAVLRKQALTWMRDHLAFCENRIRNKGLISQAHEHLTYAASDGWFAGVRDKEHLANLPESERKEWTQVWKDLASLRDKCKPTR